MNFKMLIVLFDTKIIICTICALQFQMCWVYQAVSCSQFAMYKKKSTHVLVKHGKMFYAFIRIEITHFFSQWVYNE